jgi:hypothetical protein
MDDRPPVPGPVAAETGSAAIPHLLRAPHHLKSAKVCSPSCSPTFSETFGYAWSATALTGCDSSTLGGENDGAILDDPPVVPRGAVEAAAGALTFDILG